MTTLVPRPLLKQIEKQNTVTPNLRRNCKIARLPKETRDIINRMLDDGLPYRVIIDELGEAGQGLNAQNLTNWVQGGYQEYLRQQDGIYRSKAQMEFAADLLREMPDTDPTLFSRACNIVVGSQLFAAVLDHGEEALAKAIQENPIRYLTLLNTVAANAHAAIELDKHHRWAARLDASAPGAPGRNSSQFKLNQAETKSISSAEPEASKSDSPVLSSSQFKTVQAKTKTITLDEPTGTSIPEHCHPSNSSNPPHESRITFLHP